jgi:next-to-BRCA1 protein 1
MLVRKSARPVLLLLLTAALTLTSCNLGATPAPTIDANAINTAAVSTALALVASQQTQTALAAPSATPAVTNTSITLVTVAPATNAAASPAGGALPTFSFANTTPQAGLTPLGTAGLPAGPAATLALGDACNNNQFVADTTIPDGTVFKDSNPKGGRPGSDFLKVWRVKNTGNCKWDEGYKLAFIGGDDDLEPHSVTFTTSDQFVDPGETADVGVSLTAPKFPGKYTATWRMQSDTGQFFGTPLTVLIEVAE